MTQQDEWAVLDIENVGEPWPGAGELLCVGWRDRAYTVDDLNGEYGFVLDELADDTIAKVTFTKHDHRWLGLRGVEVNGPLYDVQTMMWTANELTDLDLETAAKLYAGIDMDKRIVQRANWPWFRCDDGTMVPLEEAPLDQVLAYNERDLSATAATFTALLRKLAQFELLEHWERDVAPFTKTLLGLELRGVPLDVKRASAMKAELEQEMAELDASLKRDAGLPEEFNLGSSQQLGRYLFSKTFEQKRVIPITPEERARLKDGDDDLFGGSDFTLGKVGAKYAHGMQTLRGRGLKVHSRTDSGAPSTDAKTLKVHYGDDPWVQQLLELSSRQTIVSTFLTAFETKSYEGRLYGRFNQTGTKTGRLSSSSPNMQNIPTRGALGPRVRSLFVPERGTIFVHGDYGQLEPRMMAHWSQDPVLMEVYTDGLDIYLVTAELVFGKKYDAHDPERRLMKTYVLALGYGAGPATLRQTLAIDGFFLPLKEVEKTHAKLQQVYSTFFSWKEQVARDAKYTGFVETLSGHRRHFAYGRAKTFREIDAKADRQASNAIIQGSAADVVAGAMMAWERELGEDPALILQVHDELLGEARTGLLKRKPRVLETIRELCEEGHGYDLTVPLEFSPRVIKSWKEGKE